MLLQFPQQQGRASQMVEQLLVGSLSTKEQEEYSGMDPEEQRRVLHALLESQDNPYVRSKFFKC